MNQTHATRLTEIVSRKLGVPVTFARWDVLKTGASVPVFNVPQPHQSQAIALGLTVA